MKLGIVGLPNVGKSTLFNALTKLSAEIANFPFTTIEPNKGIVPLEDERLLDLAKLIPHEKLTFTTVEFVDIAGLVKGASKGEGLGNKFLSHVREVDGIVHVVRCFEDENVSHVSGKVDPVCDADTINTELALADLEYLDKAVQKVDKAIKGGDKKALPEKAMIDRMKEALNSGRPVRSLSFDGHEKELLKSYFLLTLKPVLYVANVGELVTRKLSELKEKAVSESAGVVEIHSKMEKELNDLSAEEALEFRKDLGISEAGLKKLVRAAHELLGLLTFFTVKEPEIRAWSVPKGTKAPEAAGKIHSDMQRGFICAETVNWSDLKKIGSWAEARKSGSLRIEGKEYIIADGDVIQFRFAV